MKPQTSILIRLAILLQVWASPLSAQIIYVNPDATGSNDGSSWQNAFYDLESALEIAFDSVSIWIAKGTYHPGGSTPDNASVFAIHHNLTLYGGFIGNESDLGERDPVLHQTILSGDINEDDIMGDFKNNKSDNTHHVVYVDSLLNLVTFDGLVIKGGHTTNFQNSPLYDRSGGGLHINSPVIINACKFESNFGREGGGLFLSNRASGSFVTKSTFSNNKSSQRGAGIYALSVSNLMIKHCEFSDNQVNRGAIAASYNNNLLIDSCFFRDNHNLSSNSGAIFSFQNIDMVVSHCHFMHNSAVIGGALVINGDQIPAGTLTNIRIQDCEFIENTAGSAGAVYVLTNPDTYFKGCEFIGDSSGFGGAMYIEQFANNSTDTNALRIDSCMFKGNKASDLGGAIQLKFSGAKIENSVFEYNTTSKLLEGGGAHVNQNCPGKEVVYRNVGFLNGESASFGGAIILEGNNAQNVFDRCLFSANTSELAGGAVQNRGGVVSFFKHSVFRENESLNGQGGAIGLSNDSSTVYLEHTSLTNNTAFGGGGAIHSGVGSGIITLENCTLDSNKAIIGFGGAIFITDSGVKKFASLSLTNCLLGYNQSTVQGGALNIVDTDTRITNSVFFGNVCSEQGIGAAMAIKATDYDTVNIFIINTTFVNNYGNFASGIAQETQSTDAALTTILQNCLFNNQGFSNYSVEGGNPVLLSNGGNMSDDISMMYFLMNEKDIHQVSPVFNNMSENDYSLTSDSPGIDGGVILNAPEFDILGNPRVNTPDIGAYEHQFPTNTKQPEILELEWIRLLPNPLSSQTAEIDMKINWNGVIRVSIVDSNGKTVFTLNFLKKAEEFNFKFHTPELIPGVYRIIATNGLNTWTTSLVKI